MAAVLQQVSRAVRAHQSLTAHYRNQTSLCRLCCSGYNRGQRSVMATALNQGGAITYLKQDEAVALDQDLMGPLGFSVDQLMELAGLSVACAVSAEKSAPAKVLVLAGPGNNGGDGLVAARHLHHFGYQVEICYPKPTKKPRYDSLVVQCKSLHLPFINVEEFVSDDSTSSKYSVIVDALFGFSFSGAPRPPFDRLLSKLAAVEGPLVASVDIPSGWHVEEGDTSPHSRGLRPGMLVSLTAPKLCARFFKGEHHYLGGRFVPPEVRDKYMLRLPAYPGSSMCVKLDAQAPQETPAVHLMGRAAADDDCLLDDQAATQDPLSLFEEWFTEASKGDKFANAVALATVSEGSQPAARMVLMKGFSSEGFTFFTNYGSRKAQELDSTPKAALCFYWRHLNRSVRVEGSVARVTDAESDAYFQSRPRGSQLGAWCSAQSSEIDSRQVLRDQYSTLEAQYDGTEDIPRPPFWGGYRIQPSLIEFWHDQSSRMHDRLQFTRDGTEAGWTAKRLSP